MVPTTKPLLITTINHCRSSPSILWNRPMGNHHPPCHLTPPLPMTAIARRLGIQRQITSKTLFNQIKKRYLLLGFDHTLCFRAHKNLQFRAMIGWRGGGCHSPCYFMASCLSTVNRRWFTDLRVGGRREHLQKRDEWLGMLIGREQWLLTYKNNCSNPYI